MEASLQQILDAREARAQRQKELLAQYQKPLICFTMNIPGPVKLDRDVAIGFFVGCRMLRDALGNKLVFAEENRLVTGCEAYYVADIPAKELKQLAVDIEDADSVGRLFDIDILDTDGVKIDRESLGYPRRKCLLCENDAVICAGRRAHPLEELKHRTGFLLYLAARQHLAEFVAVQAYLSLIQEVNTTPKPGLVDRNNTGAHPDMDRRHFFASANALRPFFCRFAEAGYLSRDLNPRETFRQIRSIGIDAEQAMFRATGGINTHKGAIFSLGILCAAAGRLSPENWQPENVLKEAAAMASGVIKADFAEITPENAKTAGERLYANHGITGIRGQAEAGFPAVADAGLPILRQGLQKGLSLNDAGAAALLHMLPVTEDTALASRSNYETLQAVQRQVAALLADDPFPSKEKIEALDRAFTQKNLSPGGTADLLAVCYFLYFLDR